MRGSKSVCLASSLLWILAGCSKDNEVDASHNVSAGCDLPAAVVAAMCPVGTSLEVSGAAEDGTVCATPGGNVTDADGGISGVCRTVASCRVRCVSTCKCGIESVTGDTVKCAPCTQSCGDGRCEGDERETCPPGAESCFPCAEDCSGSTCGDGDCTAKESPESCPQDCSGACDPSSRICVGNILQVCLADGSDYTEVDCTKSQQVCGKGQCRMPGICGNGVCETGESASCAGDCSEECGNGYCSAADGEDFETCAKDCKPTCGDGACTDGIETNASCPGDCPVTCGNGKCDGGETRKTCSADCGFCGNGECEDGFESPSLKPAGGLQSCPQDCWKITCKTDADCGDEIACTRDKCNAEGYCYYTDLDESVCGAKKKCLGAASIDPTGCCDDQDSDTFAAESCGGNDCNDLDPTFRPGAAEYCDGQDRNCNGLRAPALGSKTKLTSDAVIKQSLSVASGGDGYVASWVGTPASTPVVQYLRIDSSAKALGSVQSLPNSAVLGTSLSVGVAHSQPTGRFGIAWTSATSGRQLQWIADDGTVNPTPVSVPMTRPDMPVGLLWASNTWFMPQFRRYSVTRETHVGWIRVSEAGGATVSTEYNYVSNSYQCAVDFLPFSQTVVGDKIALVGHNTGCNESEYRFFFGKQDNTEDPFSVVAASQHINESTVLGWDGEDATDGSKDYVVAVSRATNSVRYEHIAQNGMVVDSVDVGTAALDPIATTYVPPIGPSDMGKLGVLARDAGNWYLIVRRRDSTKFLDPGLIAGGVDLQGGQLFWNGANFVAFWLEKEGSFHQLYSTTVTCQ